MLSEPPWWCRTLLYNEHFSSVFFSIIILLASSEDNHRGKTFQQAAVQKGNKYLPLATCLLFQSPCCPAAGESLKVRIKKQAHVEWTWLGKIANRMFSGFFLTPDWSKESTTTQLNHLLIRVSERSFVLSYKHDFGLISLIIQRRLTERDGLLKRWHSVFNANVLLKRYFIKRPFDFSNNNVMNNLKREYFSFSGPMEERLFIFQAFVKTEWVTVWMTNSRQPWRLKDCLYLWNKYISLEGLELPPKVPSVQGEESGCGRQPEPPAGPAWRWAADAHQGDPAHHWGGKGDETAGFQVGLMQSNVGLKPFPCQMKQLSAHPSPVLAFNSSGSWSAAKQLGKKMSCRSCEDYFWRWNLLPK